MCNSNILVSVITPLYNKVNFIEACIESVLLQTHVNWEMIIVDEDTLFNDWKCSLDIISNITKTQISAVCLPGGTFSRVHKNILLKLNINTVFHSAPSNIVLSLLYSNSFIFIPRLIITKGWKDSVLSFQSFKSYIKQILYYRY